MPRPTRLKRLIVKEVSLVDRPANPHARVLLAKRDDPTSPDLTKIASLLGLVPKPGAPTPAGDSGNTPIEDRAMPPKLTDAQVDALLKRNDELEKAQMCATCKKSTAKGEGMSDNDVCKCNMKKSADLTEEEVLKSMPGLRARLDRADKLEGVVAKMVEREETNGLMTIAKSAIGKFAAETEPVVAVLKQLDEAGRATVLDILAKGNAILKQSGLLTELGSSNGETVTANTELQKIASEIRKAEPALSQHQAIAKALKEHPELYTG